MYFMLDNPCANDDGSAWKHEPSDSGFEWRQVGPLTVTLLGPAHRALAVDSEILVDEAIAAEIGRLWPECAAAQRPANVVGPQPDLRPQANMVQLLGVEIAHAAPSIVERGDGGRIHRLRSPIVLDKNVRVTAPICKIAENRFTIVSEAVRNLLRDRESRLEFEPVPFEDEAFPDVPPRVSIRIPTRDELLRATKELEKTKKR